MLAGEDGQDKGLEAFPYGDGMACMGWNQGIERVLHSQLPQHREHDGHKKTRLQMLYLLASRQAHSRQDVARLLGVHRNTISRWLTLYATGGLAALLATYIPVGKPVSLAPAVLASPQQALHRADGFAPYEALRLWVRQTHGVEVKYKTLYTLVRTRFKIKLKVARPSHTKKPWSNPGLPGHLS
jgi:transposase